MKNYGKIFWQDLTIENADQVKDFYCEVIGWKASPVEQGGYQDWNILNDDGDIVAGICHKRGEIANFPSQWLNYVSVEDVKAGVEKCLKLGGRVIEGPKLMGKSLYAIIQDPAGASLVIIEE